ncbi:MAG: hypothetical protein ABIH50_00185 [bacterium]
MPKLFLSIFMVAVLFCGQGLAAQDNTKRINELTKQVVELKQRLKTTKSKTIRINILDKIDLTNEEIAKLKGLIPQDNTKLINKLKKQVAELKQRLKTTKSRTIRINILDKIDLTNAEIAKLKPKPIAEERWVPVTPEVEPSFDLVTEEGVVSLEADKGLKKARQGSYYEIGLSTGFFAGATVLLGEVRAPLRFIYGPATTSVRLMTGLAQNGETQARYVPVGIDLIFNFPPGVFTGVDNYLGVGLNYLVLTSGRKQGAVGGELFYGVESNGFGGVVFGEIGYSSVQASSSPGLKGATVMVGYRQLFGR